VGALSDESSGLLFEQGKSASRHEDVWKSDVIAPHPFSATAIYVVEESAPEQKCPQVKALDKRLVGLQSWPRRTSEETNFSFLSVIETRRICRPVHSLLV
jgi:hypothetical protein